MHNRKKGVVERCDYSHQDERTHELKRGSRPALPHDALRAVLYDVPRPCTHTHNVHHAEFMRRPERPI